MKKDKYKNLIFAYTVLYTFVTVLNSIFVFYITEYMRIRAETGTK